MELDKQVDWLEYADDSGLQIVEVTEGMNGYPKNLHKAVIGFDNFQDAEKFAAETQRTVVEMCRRDGHQFWKSCGWTDKPLKPTAEWYGDDYYCYLSIEEWWKEEREFLQAVLADDVSPNDFVGHAYRICDIIHAFDALPDGSQVLISGRFNVVEHIPIETMHWHDDDVTDYVIGVK